MSSPQQSTLFTPDLKRAAERDIAHDEWQKNGLTNSTKKMKLLPKPVVIDLTQPEPENQTPNVQVQGSSTALPLSPQPLTSRLSEPKFNSFKGAIDAFNTTQISQHSISPKRETAAVRCDEAEAEQTSCLNVPVPHRMDPDLCPEQRDLVNLISSGANVFYTGSAGCGKSTVLKAAVSQLQAMGKCVKIVAPTGRAAVDIGGSTIFSYAGITPDSLKMPLEKLLARAFGKVVSKRFSETDVLVIDEISMVENFMLERLSEMMKAGRQYRNKQNGRDEKAAFGGVQCVFLGDFFQLPPVKPFSHCITCGRETIIKVPDRIYRCPMHGEFFDQDKWAFKANCWEKANFQCVNLVNIHRQSDAKFIGLLEKCRMGVAFTGKERAILLNHPYDVTGAVQLFSTRAEVKHVNDLEFSRLRAEKQSFKALDGIRVQAHHETLLANKKIRTDSGHLTGLKDHRFEPLVELKTGMLVILLINLDVDAGLINGSQGRIIEWVDINESTLPIPFDSKKAKSASNTRKLTFGDHALLKADSIKQFASSLPFKKWPLVEFDNGRQTTITAECTVNELGEEEPFSIICRTQIPLLPAWAMSIHKSQGMTLSRVIVDLSKSFADGQVYVALSRAKSLQGLKVTGLGPSKATPNEEVVEYLHSKFGIRKTMYKDVF